MKSLQEAIEARAGVQGPPLAKALGLSKNGFYAAVKRGEIRSVRIGRRVIIPADEARRLLGWEVAA